MARRAQSGLITVLGVLALWPAPPCVDPQSPLSLPTPDIKDSVRLVNILIRRPTGPQTVRKECRLLSSAEFERITSVIERAKRDTRIRPNVYDAFAQLHAHPDINAGAHQGPGFLPFHRVFMFLWEKLMRLYDPSVSMCYWDSTLEPADMTSSATWTSTFFGNNQAEVVTGFPARWLTPLGPLIREGGATGRPFTQKDIRNVLSKKTLGEVSFPGGNIENNVEEQHNYVHNYVGGLMGQVETASFDPIFWFHHAFIDCIYEWFREQQRERGEVNPMRDWPAEYGDPAHSPFAAMRLGRLRMIDGTNDYFPNMTFRCEEPPGACVGDGQCGVHMRCDIVTRRCVSDTLAVRPQNQAGQIKDLGSLLGGFDGLASINTLLKTFPSRGFNQLFQMPSLSSFNIFNTRLSSPSSSGSSSSGSTSSSRAASSAGAGAASVGTPSGNPRFPSGGLSSGISLPSDLSSSFSSSSSSSSASRPRTSSGAASAADNLLTGLWNQV